jgi:hypothetical protein
MIPLILFKFIPWQFYFQDLKPHDRLLRLAASVAAGDNGGRSLQDL